LETRIARTTIDSTWLANHGGVSGPWHLKAADGPYFDLATNIDAQGTAFIVDDPNVTLDLHGYVIQYGDSAPITVPNGGFEEDTIGSHDPLDWDVSGAAQSNPTVVSTSILRQTNGPNAMYGNNMLQLTIPSSNQPQTIRSSTINLPNSLSEYTATITPKDVNDETVPVLVQVYDLDHNRYLPLGPNPAVSDNKGCETGTNRGFSPKATFNNIDPITNQIVQRVRVDITINPVDGLGHPVCGALYGNTTMYLDYAAVLRSRDYGVLAAGGYWDFPIQTGGSAIYHGSNFTLKGDSGSGILQGQANGWASSPIALFASGNFTVTGVSPDRPLLVRATGMDTNALDATYGSGSSPGASTIQNCSFVSSIDRISRRFDDIAAISLKDFSGSVLVQNNQIIGFPQVGIYFQGYVDGSGPVIQHNTIDQNALVADPYAILIAGAQNFEIGNNEMDSSLGLPYHGRGISIDSAGARIKTLNGVIHDNVAPSVYETPNLEYTAGDLYAVGLRVRNFDDSSIGSIQQGLTFSGNYFRAYTDSRGDIAAYGAWVNAWNPGTNTGANNYFRGNYFGAYVYDDGHIPGVSWTTCPFAAVAFGVAGSEGGTGLRISYNILESDDNSLELGGNESYQHANNDIYLFGNTLTRAVYGIQFGDYAGVVAGSYQTNVHQIHLLSTRLGNGATTAFQLPRHTAHGDVSNNQTPIWETPSLQDGQGNLMTFALSAADGQVYCSSFVMPYGGGAGSWSSWTLTQEGAYKAIAATVDFGSGLPEVFAIGADDQVYVETFDDASGQWNPWVLTQGGFTASAISAATDVNGNPEVVAVSQTDQKVYLEVYSSGSWSRWNLTQDGLTATAISAIPDKNGNTEVFAINSADSQTYLESNVSGQWSSWSLTLAGQVTAISVITDQNGAMELYAILSDNNVSVSTSSSPGQWSNWMVTIPFAASSLSVTLDGTGSQTPEVLAIGSADNQIYQESYTGGQWAGWNPLPMFTGGFANIR
jgi:hypothetical protein